MTIPNLLRSVALAAVSPLLEKNALKTVGLDIPVVFSMSRVVVLAFAMVALRLLWTRGIGGWPEATLAITIVLALPVLGALERVNPSAVVDLAHTLLSRVGTGAVGRAAGSEPSLYDDHRTDD